MNDPIVRKKLKVAELETAIMERLGKHPDCAGITYVYVKATGREPPAETWTHTLVSRRHTVRRTPKETAAMLAVLNDMRKEFDFLAD
jgi:hypothetical protein